MNLVERKSPLRNRNSCSGGYRRVVGSPLSLAWPQDVHPRVEIRHQRRRPHRPPSGSPCHHKTAESSLPHQSNAPARIPDRQPLRANRQAISSTGASSWNWEAHFIWISDVKVLRSVPAALEVALLFVLSMIFFSIMGFFLFSMNDSSNFGSLLLSLQSLLYLSTATE